MRRRWAAQSALRQATEHSNASEDRVSEAPSSDLAQRFEVVDLTGPNDLHSYFPRCRGDPASSSSEGAGRTALALAPQSKAAPPGYPRCPSVADLARPPQRVMHSTPRRALFPASTPESPLPIPPHGEAISLDFATRYGGLTEPDRLALLRSLVRAPPLQPCTSSDPVSPPVITL
ncbi:unnamed protein product [Symbiodinium sp. CCMP2592]|nr:unnamed protein product [Symbiodinium sp. CCMP2592]